MLFLQIDALTGYSAALDARTEAQLAALVEIVFCYRRESLSATAVFGDIETLRDVAGQVPDEIELAVMASTLKVSPKAGLGSTSMVTNRKPCSLVSPIHP